MRLFASLALALSLTLSFIPSSLGHAHLGRRRHVHRQDDLARRDPGEIALHKRFDNCRFTYYADGLGACGHVNVPTDFIVAVNTAQFSSQLCFQMITITANGKTTQAQIVDSCPGCPFGGLDFSQGLFQFFADLSAGVLYGSWTFNSGGSPPAAAAAPPPSPTPPPPPPPSPPPPPPPTSSAVPTTIPSPTTTLQLPPTTTSTLALSTTSSSGSSSTSVTSSTSGAIPSQTTTTGGAMPTGVSNSSVLSDLNSCALYIGAFLADCTSS